MNLEKLTQQVCDVAETAGEHILAIYDKSYDITQKGDSSPLTAADLASHQYICSELKKLTPDIPVLSEESADVPFATRGLWEQYWLVDPLDGTKEFIKHNGEFSVLIALIQNNRAILGIVHAPVLESTWYAWKGGGAHKRAVSNVHRIQVREAKAPYVVVGSRSHAGASLQILLEKLGSYELISMGSILKACLVAEGQADIYPRFGPTSEWDTAAAQIIVEEAGGQMICLDGTPLKYNTKDSLLNPYFLVIGENHQYWSKYIPIIHNT